MAGSRTGAVISKLMDILGNSKQYLYYVEFKYCKEILPKKVEQFSDLHKQFPKVFDEDLTQEECESWFLREDMQKAAKYMISVMKTKREIELLDEFYNQAMRTNNPKSLDCYLKLKESIFADEESVDELQEVLKNFSLADKREEEGLEMRL